MSIKTDPVAAFYDAIRALNYAQTMEVADDISGCLEREGDGATAAEVARALSDAAEGKPTAERITRGVTP